jgi:hypothetical protein
MDEAATDLFTDTIDIGWDGSGEGFDMKLASEFWMLGPIFGKDRTFTAVNAGDFTTGGKSVLSVSFFAHVQN